MDLIPKKSKSIIEREVEEGLLLLRENGEYLILNQTGSIIWKNLDKHKNISEIINSLNVELKKKQPDNAEDYVKSFLSKLVNSGYLVE